MGVFAGVAASKRRRRPSQGEEGSDRLDQLAQNYVAKLSGGAKAAGGSSQAAGDSRNGKQQLAAKGKGKQKQGGEQKSGNAVVPVKLNLEGSIKRWFE
jgi:hypothetical protein